ncbi:hypothetical protein [Halomontanus rarus]|uniref:hypothetical protein n=1 Tax=Halomontanus rarus TaxID=3034020 RepID=UPI00293BB29C|nr:hypothetical protein [Halovivax sp. KZCA124]
MDSRRIGVLAGIAGVLGLAVQHVPSFLLGRWVDEGYEGALPMIGTAGQTVVTYNLLIEIMTPLLLFVLAVGLGYYIAREVDVAEDYRHIGRTIAIGSTVGSALAAALFMLEISTTTSGALAAFFLLASFAAMVVPVVLIITIGALAGAATSYFQTVDNSPPGTAEGGTGTPPDSHSEPTR